MSFEDKIDQAISDVADIKEKAEQAEKNLRALWWEYRSYFKEILEAMIEIKKTLDVLTKE